jgi:hypothetical protein
MKRLTFFVVVMALVAAACSGSDDDGVATLEDSTTTTLAAAGEMSAQEADNAKLMAFSACMRDNGIVEFPDLVVAADGSVDFGNAEQQLEEIDQDELQGSFDACADHLDGLSFAPGGADFDFTEIQDTLLDFATCMRQNGYDIPDPDFSNFDLASGSGPFGDIDPTDPEFESAFEACEQIFATLPFGG